MLTVFNLFYLHQMRLTAPLYIVLIRNDAPERTLRITEEEDWKWNWKWRQALSYVLGYVFPHSLTVSEQQNRLTQK